MQFGIGVLFGFALSAICLIRVETGCARHTFDVAKVVRELKKLKMRYYMTIANTGDSDKDYVYLNIANAIDGAIKIVKGGGVDGH